MPAVVELTPLTLRGGDLLLDGAANVDRFQAALDRIEPGWVRHLMLRVLSQTE